MTRRGREFSVRGLGGRILIALAVVISSGGWVFAQPPLGSVPTALTSDTTGTQQVMQAVVNASARVWDWNRTACTSFTVSVINSSGASEGVRRQQSQVVAIAAHQPVRLWTLANVALKRLFIRAAADTVDDEGRRLIAHGQELRRWAVTMRDAATTASLIVDRPRSE